ncbi:MULTISPECIES: superinfection immunity protein [Pseudomonas]|jgi:hypothetical protein|uniref:Superinfection immunity protein n=1 Tax=Pseudomonas folii TaxID=2762593 RepID=A0ABR7AV83_9PSED|nr:MULTISPECIES: superinfection immunity protein [Pseudomonas]MBC3948825.1 superinfection immunity protein [Pseudomonas folii]
MHIFGWILLILLLTFSYLCRNGEGLAATAANLLFITSAVGLYFYPTLYAITHGVEIRNSIFKLNLLLGWTGIGWLAAYYRAIVFRMESR